MRGAVGYNRKNGTLTAVGPEDPSQQPKISGTTYKDTGRCEQKYHFTSVVKPFLTKDLIRCSE